MLAKENTVLIYRSSSFSQTWTDARLAWTPSSYGDMNSTTMKMSDIWIPPMVLNNAYVTIIV